ncbi:MAG: hypothetical protein ACWA5P_06960 [bacterium]
MSHNSIDLIKKMSGGGNKIERIMNVLSDDHELEKKATTSEELVTKYNCYKKSYNFEKGDIVRWKQGMRDRKIPLEGEPAIVVEVLDEPINL